MSKPGRTRYRRCRCCGMGAESAYCTSCGEHNVRHAATVQSVIRALWGSDGLHQYEIELRARRLTGKRNTIRRTV